MQSYNVLKLKCFIMRLAVGCFILLFAVSVAVAILQEMYGSYQSESMLAYLFGLLIALLLALYSALLLYQAFHFEKSVFGRKSKVITEIPDDHLNVKDIVVNSRFLLFFSISFFNLCTLIPSDDVIACFEMPVYGTIEEPGESSLTIYTKKFRSYQIPFKRSEVEDGHKVMLRIMELMPWIYTDSMESFLDMTVTKAGRRKILQSVEARRYNRKPDSDIEKEAGNHLADLTSETKEKLKLGAILSRINKGKKKN